LKRKCDSGRIRDTGRCVIKITVCRTKQQNVRWDEFGTYDVKGSVQRLTNLVFSIFLVVVVVS